MKIAVYPGSFDPLTNGHLDIICRASKLVDHLIIGVLNNVEKKPMFTINERVNMIKEQVKHLPNVEVDAFTGLLVNFLTEKNAFNIIRGFRAISDFELELQLAQTNYSLNSQVETIFLVTRVEYSFLSSSMVKQVALFDGDISGMVPEAIEQNVRLRVKEFKQTSPKIKEIVKQSKDKNSDKKNKKKNKKK